MPAQFTLEPSGAPDPKIRISAAEHLAEQLAPLLLKGSSPVLEFSKICKVGAAYERYDRVLRTAITLTKRFQEVTAFFQALYNEYTHYNSEALREKWVKAVAYIVEHTFTVLIKTKYPSHGIEFYPEHRVFIPAPPVEISTGNYPIDVIAWHEGSFSGEFLEVKKNVETYEGKAGFNEKVKTMYVLSHDLQYHSANPSIVGVATLSESPRAEQMIKSILVASGSMMDHEKLEEINPRFHIINIKNLSAWYSRKVL